MIQSDCFLPLHQFLIYQKFCISSFEYLVKQHVAKDFHYFWRVQIHYANRFLLSYFLDSYKEFQSLAKSLYLVCSTQLSYL